MTCTVDPGVMAWLSIDFVPFHEEGCQFKIWQFEAQLKRLSLFGKYPYWRALGCLSQSGLTLSSGRPESALNTCLRIPHRCGSKTQVLRVPVKADAYKVYSLPTMPTSNEELRPTVPVDDVDPSRSGAGVTSFPFAFRDQGQTAS